MCNSIFNLQFLITTHAVETIQAHAAKESSNSSPLFLYLPFQDVHSPLQVPKKYEDLYPNILNVARRQYCGKNVFAGQRNNISGPSAITHFSFPRQSERT
jgi:hypothetical protein